MDERIRLYICRYQCFHSSHSQTDMKGLFWAAPVRQRAGPLFRSGIHWNLPCWDNFWPIWNREKSSLNSLTHMSPWILLVGAWVGLSLAELEMWKKECVCVCVICVEQSLSEGAGYSITICGKPSDPRLTSVDLLRLKVYCCDKHLGGDRREETLPVLAFINFPLIRSHTLSLPDSHSLLSSGIKKTHVKTSHEFVHLLNY